MQTAAAAPSEAAVEAVHAFAHKSGLMDEVDTPTFDEMARKYIAFHLGGGLAYLPLGLDYDMRLLEHGPPIQLSAERLWDLLQGAHLNEPIGQSHVVGPEMERFLEAVLPAPKSSSGGGGGLWRHTTEAQRLRETAYFLALKLRDHLGFAHFVDSASGQGEGGAGTAHGSESQAICKAIRNYTPEDEDALASELGQVIQRLEFAPIEEHGVSNPPPTTKGKEEERARPIGNATQAPMMGDQQEIHVIPRASGREPSLCDLRPRMEAFRVRAGLSPMVTTERLAKQFCVIGLDMQDSAPTDLWTEAQGPGGPQGLTLDAATGERRLLADLLETKQCRPQLMLAAHRLRALCAATERWDWTHEDLVQTASDPEARLSAHHHQRFLNFVKTYRQEEGTPPPPQEQ